MQLSILEKSLLDENSSSILVLDHSGIIIYGNKALKEWVGISQAEEASIHLHELQIDLQKLVAANMSSLHATADAIQANIDFINIHQARVHSVVTVKCTSDSLNPTYICTFKEKLHKPTPNFSSMDNELRYQSLFENSLEIIQSFDKTGKLLFCNPQWHSLLGYSEDEASHLTLFDIIAPEYRNHCSLLFQEVLSGKNLKGIEVEFISKNGDRLFLEGNIVPLVQDGELVATHAFFRDITDKKISLQKIDQQKKLIQTVFDTVPICLYIKDSNGKYILANSTMKRTLGSEVIQENDEQLFPESSLSILRETDQEAISLPDQVSNFEISLNSKNRMRHFFSGKKAIYNDVTRAYELFGYSVDITDLKNANKLIQEKEAHLYSIINNISGGVMLFKPNSSRTEFIIDYYNHFASNLLNLELKGFLFKNLFAFLPSQIIDQLGVELVDRNDDFLIETIFEIPDENNSHRYFKIRFSKIKSANDFSLLSYIIDISKEKKLIRELEGKLKENELLIGEVHHRVKNNLAVIDGIIELSKAYENNFLPNENLGKIQSRIKSIAIVHQVLYQTAVLTDVDAINYLNELVSYYHSLYKNQSRNQIDFCLTSTSKPKLPIQKAISFALLINELITISIENAKEQHDLSIKINLEQIENNIELLYTDSTKHSNVSNDDFSKGGFSHRLIVNYTKQLKGNIAWMEDDFFSIRIILPHEE